MTDASSEDILEKDARVWYDDPARVFQHDAAYSTSSAPVAKHSLPAACIPPSCYRTTHNLPLPPPSLQTRHPHAPGSAIHAGPGGSKQVPGRG